MSDPISHYDMALTLGASVGELKRAGLQSQDPIRDALLGALVHAVLHAADKIEYLANVTEGA